MNSNFEFCNKYWPDLAALGQLAENYLYSDSNTCIIKIGMMAENILLKIFDYENISKPEIKTSLNLTNILKAEDLLPKNVENALYIIRKSRNKAVHSNYGSLDEAKRVLRIGYNLCNWFMIVYGDWKYVAKDFIIPVQEQKEIQIEELEDKTNKLLDSVSDESKQTESSDLPTEKRIEFGKETSENVIQLSPEDEVIVTSEVVRLEATVVPMINYAMTQNNIKIIPDLYIKNNTENSIEDLQIKIESSPEFIVPCTHNVSLIRENGEISIKDIKLHVNEEYLVNLTEKVSGHITIKLIVDNQELTSEIYDISLLAYDQWNGLSIYPEMLCAFITPNHPLVNKIISEATDLLDQWTRNPSMDAYQSGDKNRVRMQAAAIFGSIQKMDISYSECPASFGIGQRIRLCETIAQYKLGNCVDLTLLYASCLEAVGIHTLIILKEGHAFIGYWLKNITLNETVSDDQSIITKRIAEGINEIRVVECTAMCSKSNISYEQAETYAEENLQKEDFQCIIDVQCARLNNITPINSRISNDGNGYKIYKQEVNDVEITKAPNILSSLFDEDDVKVSEKEYTKQEQWERKLLDLGLRNRLINMHLNSSIVPILCTSIEKLENRLSNKEKFRILPKPTDYKKSEVKDDFESISKLGNFREFINSEFDNNVLHTPLTEGELTKATKNLYKNAKLSLEENGANSLFLAVGLLKWCEQKKVTNFHYAPILLFPVNLIKKASVSEYTLELREEEPQINISLMEKLKQDFGLTISGLDRLYEDESGIDVKKILGIARNGIKNQKYWDVLESSYIGIFSFSSFVMWNDLHSRYDVISQNKIVKSLIEQKISWNAYDENTEYLRQDAEKIQVITNLKDEVKEICINKNNDSLNEEGKEKQQTFLPISLDASQLAAVTEAAKGKSFILHGPPGTGKSQTITALIANALGNGQKVLFVAEKRASLEVVQERLTKIGLSAFCLEMHSNKTNKTTILEHLKQAEEVKTKRTSLDFEAKCARLETIKSKLDSYAEELHKTHENGLSLYEAINNYEKYSKYPDLKGLHFNDPEKIDFNELEQDYAIIDDLVSIGRKNGQIYNHPLSRVKLSSYTPQLKEEILNQCSIYEESIYDFYDDADEFANEINFGEINDYVKCEELIDIAKNLSTLQNVNKEWGQIENPNSYFEEFIKFCNKKIIEEKLKSELLKYFDEDFLDFDSSKYINTFNVEDKSNLNDIYTVLFTIKDHYKNHALTTFDALHLSSDNLIVINDTVHKQIKNVDCLLHIVNALKSVEGHPLKNVNLADTSILTKQKMYSIVLSYKEILNQLSESLKSISDECYFTNNKQIIEIVYLLKEWENVPKEFAKQKNISLYLSEIEKMCNAKIKSDSIKLNIDEKWNSQIYELNAENLFDEFNEIENSGIITKLAKLNSFKKKLSVYFKSELDKNDIKNELSVLVEYQKEHELFEQLFSKYREDLGYLYSGESTNWKNIIDFSHVVLQKAQQIDEYLKNDSIRCMYAGDNEFIPKVNEIISNYELAVSKKKEFDEILCIFNSTDNWIEKDIELCKFIVENKKYVQDWITYNHVCLELSELNLEEVVAEISESKNVTLISREEAKFIISDLNHYQVVREENDILFNSYESVLENNKDDDSIDWNIIKKKAEETKQILVNFDNTTPYKKYRTKYAGQESLNKYFISLPLHKEKYEKEKDKFYKLLNIEKSNNLDWYENEKDLCGNVSEQIDNLRYWTILNKAIEEIKKDRLCVVVQNYMNGISHDDLLNAYKKSYFKSLVEVIISKSLVLSDFSGGVFEDDVNTFKKLDDEIKETNQKIIYNNIVKNIPDLEKEASKSNEVAILNKAIQNKGRGKSLRKLFSQLPTLITRICPCVLMSPLSVAQYLDPDSAQFDLIVFDEASQLQTCKAIGAIARAKNAIIVGDPKQMPPTNFFIGNTYDEEHEDIEDLESILDDCLAIKMPSKHLIWHYRSTHESLIAFSNSRFYENKLYTFPSFNDRESKVKWVKVKGTFERGKKRINLVEAKAIVEELKRRCNDSNLNEDSVGVVTFNSTQQDLIEDLIAEECDKNKKFNSWVNREEDKAVFVKNLENIQGDERDVILFSICYGPDESGKISMNFGPLNKEGGWRRLNVAISRARKEMMVFTSLVPEQITLTKTEGVAALREFLNFARSGHLNLENTEANVEKYYSFGILDSICDELSQKGYKCDKLIGHSDFRIDIGVINPENPEQYLIGILIDGPNYKSAENTRDREVAQTSILNHLGWNIFRLWSLDWWNDKAKVIKQIEDEIEMFKNHQKKDEIKPIESKDNNLVNLDLSSKNNEVSNTVSYVQEPRIQRVVSKPKSLVEKIKDLGLEVIDNTSNSNIVWVVYDESKANELESLLASSNIRYALERRGAVATKGRKAYRIMIGGR